MTLITLNLPKGYITKLDELVGEGAYPNRADAMRTAIRDFLKAEHKVCPTCGKVQE